MGITILQDFDRLRGRVEGLSEQLDDARTKIAQLEREQEAFRARVREALGPIHMSALGARVPDLNSLLCAAIAVELERESSKATEFSLVEEGD